MIVDMESQKLGVGVGNDEVNAYIEQIRSRNPRRREARQGSSSGDRRSRPTRSRCAKIQRSQLLARNVRFPQVNVTPEEIQKFYDEHKAQFSKPTRVTVRHIFFAIPQGVDGQQVGPDPQREGEGVHAPAGRRVVRERRAPDVGRSDASQAARSAR